MTAPSRPRFLRSPSGVEHRAHREPAVEDPRSIAEEQEELRRSRVSLAGWVRGKSGDWTKEGVAYAVRPVHEKRVWARTDPPYKILSPSGVMMGGATYLSAAQRTAAVLGEELPVSPSFLSPSSSPESE